ncbi:hypothetical protein CA54_40310 [Symmachiella macrocystis]|uniref:Uncharacterized protein n=1 Tax=Symmachiella macrocystis TaxID=2527985 RepID=A0A5C6BEB8_9PLAN|nr:hypothetical protein [Symmachiella macrocystis]TWU08794.1 hypothetical protein CA54_40310 [Symmachiella macrocystis]
MKLSKNMFSERERSLENEFFYRVDQALIQKLKEESACERGLMDLSEVTGIADQELLGELLEVGIGRESLIALSLIPLVQIAWADRILDSKERAAVLGAAVAEGIGETTASHRLLNDWLHDKPEEKLFATWRHYVRVTASKLTQEQVERLRHDVLRRTRAIAQTTGGFLGMGSVSEAEQAILNEIEQAFEA